MTTHQMQLQSGPFIRMTDGSKTLEFRLNDQKRQNITIGNSIYFHNVQTRDTIIVTVLDLIHRNTFADLINDYPARDFLGHTSDAVALAEVDHFYTKKSQETYGVLGIQFRRL